MIVATLDTNVLASGFAGYRRPDSIPGELLRRWRAKAVRLIVSEPILTELGRVLRYPYFTRQLTTEEIEEAFVLLRTLALVQPITVQVAGVAAHRQDDMILATATRARAPFLVTGDKLLLELESYLGTRLLSPRQFLEVLDHERHRDGA